MTDKELMFQVRDGDLDRLGVLFERHHQTLFNFFLGLTGNRSTSEDLVQEVFLRLLKYRHTYKGSSKFHVWMFRIARNARADYFRREKKPHTPLMGDDNMPSEILTPTQELEQEQDFHLVHAALARLKDEDREVLLLSRFQNFRYQEIAATLGCQEGTIKARVHRAVQKLRDAYFDLSGEKYETGP